MAKMKRSYLSTSLKKPFLFETVPDRLGHLADENPDKEAYIFYDFKLNRVPVTRKQLYNTAIKLGKLLAGIGLREGDRVAFCMNNSIEMLFANMATICAGGIPFYLTTNLRDGRDIIRNMSLMEPTMLIVDTSIGDDNWKIVESIWPTDTLSCQTIPSLKYIICNGTIGASSSSRLVLAELLTSEKELTIELPKLDPDDTLAYLITSGSTGDSKIVNYTHFSLLNLSRQIDISFNIKESSRFFNDRQFSWAVGFPRTYLATGASRIFIDTRMSLSGLHIDRLADIIEREQCDTMYVPAYIAKDLMLNPQLAPKFKSVQSAMMAGERVPRANIVLKENFFKNVYTFYGTTETGGIAMFTSDNIDEYEDGIVGLPLEGVEVKLVDDNGKTVELGKSGEVCVRSACRFVEYKGQISLFNEVVDAKNWFHTGDIAHVRDDGNVVIDGRKKEHIVIQTTKYFPWSVEKALKDCPGAQFVIAVGVPDVRLTNVFCACVVPKNDVTLTADDVKRYVDEVFLDDGTGGGITNKPKYCLIFDKLILTPSGKINRLGMAQAAKGRLGFSRRLEHLTMDTLYILHQYYHNILSQPPAAIPLRFTIILPLATDKCRKGYVQPPGIVHDNP